MLVRGCTVTVFPGLVYWSACTCVFIHPSRVCRLVHQDGSLADLTMLSSSSVEATPTREEQEPQEEQQGSGAERQEQPLVAIPSADGIGDKTGIFSEQRQSSTDESFPCSAGTEPEASTEPSSGNKPANVHIYSSISSSLKLINCIHSLLIILFVACSTIKITKMLRVHFYSP